MPRKAKKSYRGKAQEMPGGGKLLRLTVPGSEVQRAEEKLRILTEQGFEYKCKWLNGFGGWLIIPVIPQG